MNESTLSAQMIARIPYWDNNFADIVDVGVTSYTQNVLNLWGTKPELTRNEQMNYKMIIVVEGNDVATSAKWALTSTSAILMSKPTVTR